jgi:hypothetical protein
MKTVYASILATQLCAWSVSGHAFTNLNFESANLTAVPAGQTGGSVPIGQALPGWSGFLGSEALTQVLQNSTFLSLATIDILGPDWAN